MVDKNNIIIEEIYDLIPIMLDDLEKEPEVSVVADLDTVWDLAEEFYNEYEYDYDYVDINRLEYDREYILTLRNNGTISVEPTYNAETNTYLASDGLVYVSEDVNSKYVLDCKKNKYIFDFRPVIFGYRDEHEEHDGEDCKQCNLEKYIDGTRYVYYIPVCFDDLAEKFDKVIDSFFEECFC